MMMKWFGGLILAGIVLAGCTGGSKTAKVDPPAGNTGGEASMGTSGVSEPGSSNDPGGNPAVPGITTTPADKNGAGVLDPGKMDIKVPPVKIDSNDKKWKETPTTPVALAQRMDRALASLKNAQVMAQISYQVPSVGKLSGKTLVKIKDQDTFSVEYFMPDTSGNKNVMVSDDGKTAYMRDGRWVGKKPKITTNTSTDAGAVAFEEKFSEEMYARFLADRDCWGPIIKAWQSGKGGYKLTMHETSVKDKDGKVKPFYRLLATRNGASKAQVEVRVDGTRYLPVAVRVLRTNKDGTQEELFWNAAWGFGGAFKKDEFPIPKVNS